MSRWKKIKTPTNKQLDKRDMQMIQTIKNLYYNQIGAMDIKGQKSHRDKERGKAGVRIVSRAF